MVNHVSLTLNQGDIYGLIGADDSGKTMFLRLVCGLTRPTEGSVSLFGATGERQLQKARKTVGSMVGNPVFYRDLSALENLIVQSRYFRHPVSKKEMWELLEQVERFPGLATRYGFLHEGRLVRELCEENAEKEQIKGNEADTAGGLEGLSGAVVILGHCGIFRADVGWGV